MLILCLRSYRNFIASLSGIRFVFPAAVAAQADPSSPNHSLGQADVIETSVNHTMALYTRTLQCMRGVRASMVSALVCCSSMSCDAVISKFVAEAC